MIKVGIIGYGTIGKRVADAVNLQGDMKVVGVVKKSKDYSLEIGLKRGLNVVALNEQRGGLEELVKKADIIVDASPGGIGEKNKEIYLKNKKKAIFEGGEKASVAEVSFTASCNYGEAYGKNYIRVVSCNTTGLVRVLHPLNRDFGIREAFAVVIRRAADPKETKRGPINSIVLDPVTLPSHHSEDVKTVIKGLNITTVAFKIPTTLMHVHSLRVSLEREASKEEITETLIKEPRVIFASSEKGFNSTSQLIEAARDLGRLRNDIYETVIWKESLTMLNKKTVYLTLGIHQEAIVIPENIDAIRASLKKASKQESIKRTNESLGILKEEIT